MRFWVNRHMLAVRACVPKIARLLCEGEDKPNRLMQSLTRYSLEFSTNYFKSNRLKKVDKFNTKYRRDKA